MKEAQNKIALFLAMLIDVWGTRQRSWLRHYATSRKVAGSSPDEVVGLFSFYLILPSAL
jgi:hypothetical protein